MKTRVLVVDDMQTIHSWVRGLLMKSPEMEVQSAFNGQEALTALASPVPFDVILLDWEMPVLNGLETLTELNARGIQVPVIMMTTKSAPQEIETMLRLGAREYLMKPFTAEILFGKLGAVLEKDIPYVA